MKIISKLTNWLSGLWNKLNGMVDKVIPIAVYAVEATKKVIDSEEFIVTKEIVKTFLPDVGDAILDKVVVTLEKNIPKIAIQLEIIKNISEIEGTPEQMKEALLALKNVFGEKWEKFCTGMAQEIVVVMSDGDITTSEAWTLTKRYYDDFVKGK